MSFRFSFMVLFLDDLKILVEAEDRAGQQERLRHVVEQPSRHVVDVDHLIRHERDAAQDEQHRTGILRDFETFCVFHGVRTFIFSFFQFFIFPCPEEQTDDVTNHLEDLLNCFVHNFDVLNGLKIK